jgi:hypothetical protein
MTAWWFTPPAIRANVVSKLPTHSAQPATANTRAGKAPLSTTVYKWTDANGQAHFSNTPPKNQKYETLSYRNDANVVGTD